MQRWSVRRSRTWLRSQLVGDAFPLCSDVLEVADARVVYGCQVRPDLMHAAGLRPNREERRTPKDPRRPCHRVKASRGRSVSGDILVRLARSRPIGSSTVPSDCTRATVNDRRIFLLDSTRSANCAESVSCAASLRATAITPEVPLSSRCTMPGRSSPPMRERLVAIPIQEPVHQRGVVLSGAGVDDESGRFVDDHQVVVLVDDLEVDGLRVRLRRGILCEPH